MLKLGRQSVLLVAALLAVSAVVFGATSPAVANNCWVDNLGHQHCDVVVTDPGTPGTISGPGAGPADFTPGPTSCVDKFAKPAPAEIPCSNGKGWWDNARQCYWTLDDPQRSAPGRDPSVGAFYSCDPLPSFCASVPLGSCFGLSQWLAAPPPGIQQYTPAQAAGKLAKTFVLTAIDIGMAPEEKVHTDDPAGTAAYRRTWVGIPVWLWVNNPTSTSWGPELKTATLGGVTVTATAKVQSLTWNSGDGQNVTCGAGTPFNAAAYANTAAVDSPTCGLRYQRTSKGGAFTVTATTNWVVEWSGEGQTGNIQMPTTSTSTTLRVGELQSVNVVTPAGDTKH